MVTGLLPKTVGGGFLVGAVSAVVVPVVFRPVLVGVVRAGYEIKNYAGSAWATAKTEAAQIRDEARAPRGTAQMEAEIQQLRHEISTLKANRKPA